MRWLPLLTATAMSLASSACRSLDRGDGGDRADNTPGAYADMVAPKPRAVTHFLVRDSGLLLTATAATKVRNPFTRRGLVSNGKGVVRRGAQVAVLGQKDVWSRVVMPDGATGWFRTKDLATIGSVGEATVLETTKVYSRPHEHAEIDGRTLAPGAFLLVTEFDADFGKVTTENDEAFWVRATDLVDDAQEVAVSKMMAKVRYDRRVGLGPFYGVHEKARNEYSGTRLFRALDELIGDER